MELSVNVVAQDGRTVKMTANQANAIQSMSNCRKGGMASVKGYRITSGREVPTVVDMQMITRFSVDNLYKRRVVALEGIEFADVMEGTKKDPVLSELSVAQLKEHFDKRKAMLESQLLRKLTDQPKNAHQEGHERCYAHIEGIKVHLVTEKVDGIKQPVENADGSVNLDTIMVPYLEVHKTVREEGKRKTVNSGAPVRMGNLIEGCLNKRSVVYKTLSLKGDNFESFVATHQEFLPEHVTQFGSILDS